MKSLGVVRKSKPMACGHCNATVHVSRIDFFVEHRKGVDLEGSGWRVIDHECPAKQSGIWRGPFRSRA